MPKLYSSSQIIKVLQAKGFVFVSQKGSHVKYWKENGQNLVVIIPAGRKGVLYGTFKSILRQSRLSEDEFKNI